MNEESKNKELVVITEIPYMLNKSSLVEQIAQLVQDKRLKDISDLRDESEIPSIFSPSFKSLE